MDKVRNVALIDSDFRRRAAVSFQLSSIDVHVEPFEDIGEIERCWPRTGAILIEDRGSSVRDLVDSMCESGRWLPIIAFSDAPATDRIVRAIFAGALDYFEWPTSTEQLVHIIDTAETASVTIGSLKLREMRAKSRLQRLTNREREVLAGVTDGLSNRRIGEQLAISPRTVEIHRANMLTKIGAAHTSEAIRVAIEASLVS